MKLHLAGVHLGEEIAAQRREEHERRNDQDQEESDRPLRFRHCPRHAVPVALAKDFEALLEVAVDRAERVERPRAARPCRVLAVDGHR